MYFASRKNSDVLFDKDVLVDFPDSDMTVFATDGAQFNVHQVMLSVASPRFKNLFRSQQPLPKSDYLQMTDDGWVLDALFRVIYATPPKYRITSITEASTILKAARQLELRTVEAELISQVEKLLEKTKNPLQAWARAIHCDAEDARKAAILRYLHLEEDLIPELIKEASDDLRWATARDHYRLVEWRKKAIVSARAIGTEYVSAICTSKKSISLDKVIGAVIQEGNPFDLLVEDASALLRVGAKMAAASCSCATCRAEPLPVRVTQMRELAEKIREVLDAYKGDDFRVLSLPFDYHSDPRLGLSTQHIYWRWNKQARKERLLKSLSSNIFCSCRDTCFHGSVAIIR